MSGRFRVMPPGWIDNDPAPAPAPRPDDFTPRDAGAALGELAREAGAQLLDDFGRPEFRAGFGAAVVTAAVLARTRLPGAVVVIAAAMVGAAVEQGFGMALDIHERLTGDAPR